MGLSVPEGSGRDLLERAAAREWAGQERFGAAHQRVHRYRSSCLHTRKQHVLWCRRSLNTVVEIEPPARALVKRLHPRGETFRAGSPLDAYHYLS
jgi:hypothetical protein